MCVFCCFEILVFLVLWYRSVAQNGTAVRQTRYRFSVSTTSYNTCIVRYRLDGWYHAISCQPSRLHQLVSHRITLQNTCFVNVCRNAKSNRLTRCRIISFKEESMSCLWSKHCSATNGLPPKDPSGARAKVVNHAVLFTACRLISVSVVCCLWSLH